MKIIKLLDMQTAMHNSIRATFEKHKHVTNEKLLYFQDRFEYDYDCRVVKSYAQKQFLMSPVVDIMYWNALKFKHSHDVTMFVLRWA
jgi:hypothetical protein